MIPWLLLLALVMVGLLIAILIGRVIFFKNRSSKEEQVSVVPEEATFLSSCTNRPCGPLLVCDPLDNLCRKTLGEPCSSYADCLSSSYCAGICLDSPTSGGLDENCPCRDGYTCVRGKNETKICKKAIGEPATSNRECASARVNNGVCSPGYNGVACRYNGECLSNKCDSFFCQDLYIPSGSLGAGCGGDCLDYSGSKCTSGNCICRSGEFSPGICLQRENAFNAPCTYFQGCLGQLACLNSRGKSCSTNDSNCACYFPYPDPAKGSQCIPGMSLDGTGSCKNDNYVPCTANSQCRNDNCSGPSSYAKIVFSPQVYAAKEISLSSASLPFTFSENDKVFSVPFALAGNIPRLENRDSGEDLIFVVSVADGLYCGDENGGWEELLPATFSFSSEDGRLTEASLQSAATNGIIFLVVATLSSGESVLCSLDATRTAFAYNSTAGIAAGVQMTNSGDLLLIDDIDISPPNNDTLGGDLLLRGKKNSSDPLFDYYLKKNDQTVFTITSSGENTRRIFFYYDPTNGENENFLNQVILGTGILRGFLIGSAVGATIPGSIFDDRYNYQLLQLSFYSSPQQTIGETKSLLLVAVYDQSNTLLRHSLIYSQGNASSLLPVQVGRQTKVLMTSTGMYVFASNSCL